MNAIYAQGSTLLKYAQQDYKTLKAFIQSQAEGLALCGTFLKVRI
jgi:hypothetical protein